VDMYKTVRFPSPTQDQRRRGRNGRWWLDWLAGLLVPTQPMPSPSLAWMNKGQDQEAREARQDWSAGPCNPCLHVWGKVERQHQMGGLLGGGWRSHEKGISKSGLVRPCSRKYL
jgi:hypothetical protein